MQFQCQSWKIHQTYYTEWSAQLCNFTSDLVTRQSHKANEIAFGFLKCGKKKIFSNYWFPHVGYLVHNELRDNKTDCTRWQPVRRKILLDCDRKNCPSKTTTTHSNPHEMIKSLDHWLKSILDYYPHSVFINLQTYYLVVPSFCSVIKSIVGIFFFRLIGLSD